MAEGEQQPAAPVAPQATQGQAPQQGQVLAGILAEIVEVRKGVKTGMYGEIYVASCRVLEGKDKGRVIRRNILGPVRTGDIVRLTDTSREAREIRVK
jgi:small subunit ribosomal protein S28e